MLYAQSGSLLSHFAKDSTDRLILGFTVPASWFQSAHPLFILLLAPVSALLWLRLGPRVGVPRKFGAALVLVGSSFVVMAGAALAALGGDDVSPLWLLSVYLLQACGELALAPVAMSRRLPIATSSSIWLTSRRCSPALATAGRATSAECRSGTSIGIAGSFLGIS